MLHHREARGRHAHVCGIGHVCNQRGFLFLKFCDHAFHAGQLVLQGLQHTEAFLPSLCFLLPALFGVMRITRAIP